MDVHAQAISWYDLLVRKSPLKRKSKSPIVKTQDTLWELCKQIIRLKYGNICYTCGKTGLAGSSWHTGHFIAKSICGAYLKYDLRNLRPQCYRCNIDLSGSGAIFYRKLVEVEGQKYVDKLFLDKQNTVKAIDHYLMLIPQYEQIYAQLLGQQSQDNV